MLGVQPHRLGIKGVFFLEIHHSVGAVDALQREQFGQLAKGEKLWNEAGDDGEKYDEANAITRQAEEKIASAEGRST